MKTLIVSAALALAAFAAPASAAPTYNVVTDFGNPVFSYGFGSGATTFTAAPFSATCFGNPSLSCYAPSSGGVPTVLKNNSNMTVSIGTPSVPTNMLLLHPGGDAASDAVLRFTSASGGIFDVSGAFARLDTSSGSGNGVVASLFTLNGGVSAPLFSTTIASNDFSSNLFGSRVTLAPGGSIVFAVNNNGEISYDSTGLRASITAVPEPATWAMMLMGFGMVGFGLRSRRKQTVRVTYA